ncbi:hypothetical protein NB861_33725, partial [Pseudomonas aeruginosa]|uniref:hypothetical protein n=1 Tax=Pseudomonas aeruginosa TaxID=287 RepID=UPI0022CD2BEA
DLVMPCYRQGGGLAYAGERHGIRVEVCQLCQQAIAALPLACHAWHLLGYVVPTAMTVEHADVRQVGAT